MTSHKKIIMLIIGIAGMLLGLSLSERYADRFTEPEPLSKTWARMSSLLEPGGPEIARGAHIVDGAMVLTRHISYPSDRLETRVLAPIDELEIELMEDSGVLQIVMGSGKGSFVNLLPGQIQLDKKTNPWLKIKNGPVRLKKSQGGLQVVDKSVKEMGADFSPGRIEIRALSGQAKIRKISLFSEGNLSFSENYKGMGNSNLKEVVGIVIGLFFGLSLGLRLIQRRILSFMALVILWSVPVLLVVADRSLWFFITEKLYLTDPRPWELAGKMLLTSLTFPLAAFLLQSGSLNLDTSKRRSQKSKIRKAEILWAASMTMTLLSTVFRPEDRGPAEFGFFLIFFSMPLWTMRRGKFRNEKWLYLDLPTAGILMVFGIGGGMFAAICWRLLVLTACSGTLRRWRPRPAVDQFFLLIILLPLSIELLIRHSPADKAWKTETLKLKADNDQGWSEGNITWSGKCGVLRANKTVRLSFAGGSSTGGAYQFKERPEVFFPAQTHKLLCGQLPKDTLLITTSFGASDQNTFTISRSIAQIQEKSNPDLLVVYTGVNDVLNYRYPQSRKEREEAKENLGSFGNRFGKLGRDSRTLTGISLLSRKTFNNDQDKVPEVSVREAGENFKLISQGVEGKVLLLTELVISATKNNLKSYSQTQQNIAATFENVSHLDLRQKISDAEVDSLLLDINHLSEAGNHRLGKILAPVVNELLFDKQTNQAKEKNMDDQKAQE